MYTSILKSVWLLFLLYFAFLATDSEGAAVYRETAVVRAVRMAGPMVVNISSSYDVRLRQNPFSGSPLDSLFDSFFRDFLDPGHEERQQRTPLGSGVIIDGKRGFILTNHHVVSKTGKLFVSLQDEREFEATIVGADPDSDIAVLRISSEGPLPAIEMGSSDGLMIGETVIAIGNPYNYSHTVTTGVISALSRSIRIDDTVFQDLIQTDAAINPGNSGGPLLNIAGELIGINTAIHAAARGIGFAIPINTAKRIVSDLIRHGEVIQAWIGIGVQDIDLGLAQYLRATDVNGVLITQVDAAGPAAAAGIQDGDILLALGKKKVFNSEGFHLAMKSYAEGDTIEVLLWRSGKERLFTLKASVFPLGKARDLAYQLLGVSVDSVPSRSISGFRGQTEGVVITDLHRRSYLARIGVRPGDIIRQIDDMVTDNVDAFDRAVVKYRNKPSVFILLQRGGHLYHLSVKL